MVDHPAPAQALPLGAMRLSHEYRVKDAPDSVVTSEMEWLRLKEVGDGSRSTLPPAALSPASDADGSGPGALARDQSGGVLHDIAYVCAGYDAVIGGLPEPQLHAQ